MDMDEFLNIWTVTFIPDEEPTVALAFVFLDVEQAALFADHLRTYYQRPLTTVVHTSTDTYDTAVVALVEAVGPSADS